MITGTEFLTGLGQATARVTRLRHFPYWGAIRLARLGRVTSWVRQKPYLKLVLALSLNPGWVSWVNRFM
jgi:hypothetical protein